VLDRPSDMAQTLLSDAEYVSHQAPQEVISGKCQIFGKCFGEHKILVM
jgi:hypothetical protein